MDERKVRVEGQLGFSLDLSEEQFKVLYGDDIAAAKALLVDLIQLEQCNVCALNHVVGDSRFSVAPYVCEGTLGDNVDLGKKDTAAFSMQRSDDKYGDFPSLDEIKRDYMELMDITKGVRSIEQAKEVAEKHKLIIEINGVSLDEFENGLKTINGRSGARGSNSDIEWIRYEAYGCLAYVYDRFDGRPMFDVWSNVACCEFITDIHIEDLTEENYKRWVSAEKERLTERGIIPPAKADEMISREAVMSEIVSYNVQHGRSYASMDADWKKAWGIIADYGVEDCDLVSREGLLDAVLYQFGCDLAYYGGDLRFIQEAIEQSPAVSAGKVDELISDAAERSEAENQPEAVKSDVDYGKA